MSDDVNRSHQVKATVTPEQDIRVKARTKALGISASNHLRELVLKDVERWEAAEPVASALAIAAMAASETVAHKKRVAKARERKKKAAAEKASRQRKRRRTR